MKDRLQLRFDHYSGYTSKDEIRNKIEEFRNDPLSPLPWALKGEPIVFFYKESGATGYTPVLAIGVEGDGETPNRNNDYYLIDAHDLEKSLSAVTENAEENANLISGLTEEVTEIISSIGLEPDGTINWHREHNTSGKKDLAELYPEAENTDIHNLLVVAFRELKDNLNENLRLEYADECISIYNGDSDEPISQIDVTDFIKDGFLDNVTIITPETQENDDIDGYNMSPKYGRDIYGEPIEGMFPYLMFVWNTDTEKSISRVGLHNILNPYRAGNGLNLNGDEFSIKIDESNSENFISVDNGGLKVTGIQNAINTAKAAATTEVTDDNNTRFVTVSSRTDSDGHTIYIIKENDIASESALSAETENRINSDALLNTRLTSDENRLAAEISERENLTDILEQSALTINARVDTLSADTHDMERDIETLSAYTIGNVNQLANNDTLMAQDISDLSGEIDAAKDRIEDLEQDGVLGVDPSDKMLTIANNLIAATFNVEYDAELKQIKFFGKNNSLLGTVNTSDFVIDGMINGVSVVEEGGVKYLRFVFNTDAGKQDIDIELTDLVTEYTVAQDSQSFLYIDGFEIGAKVNTTDNTGLATEYQLHALEDIVGDGFNTETEQHTLTQKIRHIEETLGAMPTAEELDDAMEDIQKIKDVLAVQLRTRTVNPAASVKLSFFGAPVSDYIKVGTAVQPVISVIYTDGKYIAANGSETMAGCEVSSNSEKYLKLNGETIGTLAINQDSPTAVTIQDGEYSASAHVVYLEGSTQPLDAFGEPNESIRIPAGTIDCETEKVIKAYRPIYYGPFDPDNYSEINATTIANMISGGEFIELPKYSWGEKEYITVQDGTKAFAIIVPSDNDRFVGGEIKAILDNKDHGFNIIDQFDKFNLPNVRTYAGDNTGYAYVAYVYQPATEMEESYFKVIY